MSLMSFWKGTLRSVQRLELDEVVHAAERGYNVNISRLEL